MTSSQENRKSAPNPPSDSTEWLRLLTQWEMSVGQSAARFTGEPVEGMADLYRHVHRMLIYS